MAERAGEDLLDEVRDEAHALLGRRPRRSEVALLQARGDTVVAGVGEVVVKLTAPAVDAERTAAVVALARTAGVPVPAVLATGGSVRRPGWRCVVSERAHGVQWRELHPELAEADVRGAHEQLAEALLAVQSVRFPALGELRSGPGGLRVASTGGAVEALRRRAALRVRDAGRRAAFEDVLRREADLLEQDASAVLCHDDLHSANVLFSRAGGRWRLSAVLDWDKAWSGPAESDVARTGFWDGMTGPGFWAVYRAAVSAAAGSERRALVHRLLWCLEHEDPSARHAADTAGLCRALGVAVPD